MEDEQEGTLENRTQRKGESDVTEDEKESEKDEGKGEREDEKVKRQV